MRPAKAAALQTPVRWAPLVALVVLALWLAFFAVAGPYVAWRLAMVPGMRIPLDVLFFLPQLMFPFFGAVQRGPSGGTAAFSAAAQYGLTVILWGTVAVAFVYLARRYRLRRLMWLAPVAILAVTLVVNVVLVFAGAGVELDGP